MTAPLPRWRGDDAQRIPFREWCRTHLPKTHENFAVIDLDAIMRSWTFADPTGAFMLLETKTHGKKSMTGAQIRTFALLDELLSHSPRYRGFYLLVFSGESFEDSERVWLNDKQITEAEAIDHFTCAWPAVDRYIFKLRSA